MMDSQINYENVPLNILFNNNSSSNKQTDWSANLGSLDLLFEESATESQKIIEAESKFFEHFDKISMSLLIHLFSYLDLYSLVSASQVNKTFLMVANDNEIWRNLLRKYFNYVYKSDKQKQSDFKQFFVRTFAEQYQGLNANEKYTFTLAKNNDADGLTNHYINVNIKDKYDRTIAGWARLHKNQQALDYLFNCYLVSAAFDKSKNSSDDQSFMVRTSLSVAVWNYQSISMLKMLIMQGADINGYSNNYSPLHCAAMTGQELVTTFLIEKGANIDEVDKLGATPLFIAVFKGNLNIVKLLLSHHANIEIPLQKSVSILQAKLIINDTPLSAAIKLGHVEIAQALLDKGADPNQFLNIFNALNLAAVHGQLAIVKLLIESKKIGIDSCKRHEGGATALFFAVENDHEDIVAYLIQQNADVSIGLYADDDYHKKFNVDAGDTPLHVAVKLGKAELICKLLVSDVDINIKDKLGRSPLHLAVLRNDIEIVKLLLIYRIDINVRRVDVNACDNDGATPLLLAVELGNLDLVEILLNHRADPSIALKKESDYHEVFNVHPNDHPLKVSLIIKNQAIFKKILPNISDTDIKNDALCVAAAHGLVEEIELLIKSGAEINKCKTNGATPLFFAVVNKQKEVTILLLKHGANVNVAVIEVDDDFKKYDVSEGDTPLHISARNGDIGCAHELLRYNANVEFRNSNKRTPLNVVKKGSKLADELKLISYLAKVNRRPDDHHKTKIKVFGHTLKNFGAPAKIKKELANAAKSYLFNEGGKPNKKDHKKAMGGDLSKIVKRLGI